MPIIKEKHGYCPCCEESTVFKSEHTWLRDNYKCSSCKSIPRERAISYVIDSIFPNLTNISIHESSPGHRGASLKLKNKCKNYTPSHFYPSSQDSVVNGFRNINLHRQEFDDEQFDLVVTQDVFEHLPFPKLALLEIKRTLKSGGYFISTIPLVNRFKATVQWAELVENKVHFLYAPDYHGNPIDPNGSPVFWHFGYDLASRFVEWSDMETIIFNNTIPDYGIEAELIDVIVCKKR
jgi:SAM-dependent methyltransferase